MWAEGFGWADLEKRVPVAPGTRFRIGTASVPLTSAAVGLLVEKEQLHLDAEIQTYVPAFPDKQWPIKLRQLMGHTAGVRSDAGDEEPTAEHCERTADGLKRFADHPLLFEPGSELRGSSYGWILVSAAVEAAANEPFFTFMRNQVFEPLGMRDTTADATTDPIPDLATYYFPRFGADPRYGPQAPEPVRFVLLRGCCRLRVHAVRSSALRDGDQQRQAAETRHGPIAPGVTTTELGGRDGLRSWLEA